jgi:hypothetical protein
MTTMLGFYLILIFVAILFVTAGYDATMRLFYYADLQLRYAWIQFKMSLMRRKLRKQLISQNDEYKKLIKEINDDRS